MDPSFVDIIRSAVHEWVTPRVRLPLWYYYGGHPTWAGEQVSFRDMEAYAYLVGVGVGVCYRAYDRGRGAMWVPVRSEESQLACLV